ncbi:formimidoylglutamate deiminase [Pseudomonas sp. KNUC1026]|uniref:formimidoylglutamate deiminase n=1 Tax=Pseudomonas sp. KNUC1026 TaxID=2893890 RepID=UPI001F35DF71|nr:formimidoylglutamate deiminase [Pseudomonas sp. KNUC1026]UFH50375.1 formimidoylglutamate deiminase [Pseudomonas sp. KNUC1026]
MPIFFAARALLPEGWAENVRFEVDARGYLHSVQRGSTPSGAELLQGPVVPGMPNLHSHAFQRAMAGLAEVAGATQDSFWTWRDLMYRMVGRLEPEHLEVVARQLYIEMLKAGYTSVAEFHYVHNDPQGVPYANPAELGGRIAQAACSAGIGLTLLPVLYSYSGFGAAAPSEGQRRFINSTDSYLSLLPQLAATLDDTQRLGLCFHSLRAVSAEQLTTVLGATDARWPVHIHIAEQQKEVNDCLAWSGRRPIEWLYDQVAVDERWCLVHATHAEPHEVALMAQSRAVAGLCLTTEANLGDGLFPATDFLAAGGRFGIGSDSHVSVSPAEELRWLEYGQRLRDQQRNRLVGAQQRNVGQHLYEQALHGGAAALGQPVGALSVGQRADWVVLDGADPYLSSVPAESVLNRWLFAGGDRQVRDVMVGGRWVVQAGRHRDEAASATEFAKVLNTLLA